MEPIQILALIFALFSLSRAILRFRDKQISVKEFLFWILVWVAVIAVAINPDVAKWVSTFFGVGRPIDLVIYISIIVLFYLIFRVYVHMQNLEHDMTTLVRAVAKDKKKKK